MKRNIRLSFIPLVLLLIPVLVSARAIDPVVSTDWLEKNLTAPKLVIVDIRKVEDYRAGHIPGAISIFYGSWAVKRNELLNELPHKDDLTDLLIDNGIQSDSLVVVVGKTDTPPERADRQRVALTLLYAGIPNVAMLDGGQEKWAAEKKALSTEAVNPKESSYEEKFNPKIFADKKEVLSKLGEAVIGDVRESAFYKGEKKMDFVAKAGRIKGAVNLPTDQVYTASGTFQPKEDLLKMAEPVVGSDKTKEIILYCDTGKVCSTWWFLLQELLGYQNVRVYDGSMQEWAMDPDAPIEP